jgi:hypothetical protein
MATSEEMRKELEAIEEQAEKLEEAIWEQESKEKAAAEAAEAESEQDSALDEGERVNVQVLVNGQDVGNVEGNRVLGAVIQEFGARHGLRTVVAFSGDARLTADQATRTLQDLGVSTLDVRTKDQRA